MILPRWDELKLVLSAHHLFNLVLSLAFLVTKGTPLCPYVFLHVDECEIDSREREILMFLAIIIAFKGRKASNWLHYLSTVFLFSKLANAVLFFRGDLILGIVYGLLCLVQMVIFPEPAFNGPENVTYYQGSELFDQLTRNRGTTYVIEFYTSWSPDCRHIAPVFAKLSESLSLSNLKFGKLDLGRWPNEANRFYVNAGATSKQLPTICVFQDGKEIARRPIVRDQRAVPFVFTEENCLRDLGLRDAHQQCKAALARKKQPPAAGDSKKTN